MIKEKGVFPVDLSNFRKNTDKTLYIQDPEIAKKVINNLSADSMINVNVTIESITSKTDTPKDEEF